MPGLTFADPAAVQAVLREGLARHRDGDFASAEAAYRRVIEVMPELPDALHLLGAIFLQTDRHEAAADQFTKALALNPDNSLAHANIGLAFYELGRHQEAETAYGRAIALDPDLQQAHSNLGRLYVRMNRLDDAEAAVAKAFRLAPGDASNLVIQGILHRLRGNTDEALAIFQGLAVETLTDIRALEVNFEIARLYDLRHDSDAAHRHFVEGNAIQARGRAARDTDRRVFLDVIDHTSRVLTAEWIDSWRSASRTTTSSSAASGPVFMVGFPRSGTTLIDQMLDSHPDFQVMEERPALDRVSQAVAGMAGGYPGALADLDEAAVEELRAAYFEAVDQFIDRRPGAILVDKFPLAMRHAALIARLFPDCRIILSMRHPCDVVLSCFMQHFSLNEAMVNFFSISDSARTYGRVMGLWRRSVALLPLNVHTVKYESLVDDFEAELRRLLDFLDVPWDDAVLDYRGHAKRRGVINTPSYQQVTEPIYRRAAGRWKRYKAYLAPVMDDLAPFMEAFGYNES